MKLITLTLSNPAGTEPSPLIMSSKWPLVNMYKRIGDLLEMESQIGDLFEEYQNQKTLTNSRRHHRHPTLFSFL